MNIDRWGRCNLLEKWVVSWIDWNKFKVNKRVNNELKNSKEKSKKSYFNFRFS